MEGGFSMEGIVQAEIVNLGLKGLVLPAFTKPDEATGNLAKKRKLAA
jgi:hypothetical protein